MLKNRDYRLRFATAVLEALIKDQATDPDADPASIEAYLAGGESEGELIRRLVRYEFPDDEVGISLAASRAAARSSPHPRSASAAEARVS